MKDFLKLLTKLLTAAAVFAGFFLAARELWLMNAEQELINELNRVSAQLKSGKMKKECSTQGNAGVQLRFVSPQAYVVDMRCPNPGETIQLRADTLPKFVQKDPGSAGLIQEDPNVAGSSVTLSLWGRTKKVVVGSPDPESWQSPSSVCAGFGFSCCNPRDRAGAGKRAPSKALDCPNECFAQCQERPIILGFRSDPPVDIDANQVELRGSATGVTFSYLVQDLDSPIQEVVIEYGDGASDRFTKDKDSKLHTYSCSSRPCTFNAKLRVTDAQGNTSNPASISTIKVVVK